MKLTLDSLMDVIKTKLHDTYLEQQATQSLLLATLKHNVHDDIYVQVHDFLQKKVYAGAKFPRISMYISSDVAKKQYRIYKSLAKKILYKYALYYYLYAVGDDMLKHDVCTNGMYHYIITMYKCMLADMKQYDVACFDTIQKLLLICEEMLDPLIVYNRIPELVPLIPMQHEEQKEQIERIYPNQ